MREAIGGTWIFGLVIVFIVLFTSYLALSVNYSKAFKAHRNIVVKENFTWVISVVAIVVAGSFSLKYYLKRKKGES